MYLGQCTLPAGYLNRWPTRATWIPASAAPRLANWIVGLVTKTGPPHLDEIDVSTGHMTLAGMTAFGCRNTNFSPGRQPGPQMVPADWAVNYPPAGPSDLAIDFIQLLILLAKQADKPRS